MNMPQVIECNVSECAYNTNKKCHALAITIGDQMIPHCVTFFKMMPKGGDSSAIASVGACKVHACAHNKSLVCQAPEVIVGYLNQDIECMTFTKK